jgi:hypothetical protein
MEVKLFAASYKDHAIETLESYAEDEREDLYNDPFGPEIIDQFRVAIEAVKLQTDDQVVIWAYNSIWDLYAGMDGVNLSLDQFKALVDSSSTHVEVNEQLIGMAAPAF